MHERLRVVHHPSEIHLGEWALALGRFGLVGLSGLVVNTILIAFFAEVVGINYVVAAILATQGSTLWNFSFTELWVFPGRQGARSRLHRMGMFYLVNNAALLLRIPLLFVLTSVIGVHYLLSNFLSLAGLTLIRYTISDLWIWGQTKSHATDRPTFSYDVHGILSVVSEVRLPELECFKVNELPEEPTLSVRIGKVEAAPLDGESPRPSATKVGFETEQAPAHRTTRIHYTEGPGSIGFGIDISMAERIEILASPLLRRSPHVLYTNVVEPILRWTFVERGYALVHGACFSDGDRAFVVTAGTDTGKTTTILKTLDEYPYSFMSDDLTLVAPDGRVLSYPKPLTISRHTVQAVKRPLLSRRQRAALVLQSRLHSRSARRFAMLLAKTRMPAALINTIAQMLVPPPKYRVERLIPDAQVTPEAYLCGLVVIERGGLYSGRLDSVEALEMLMSNCADAFGFPPYSAIAGSLLASDREDLPNREREIVSSALNGVTATLMRSETMDWAARMPAIVGDQAGRNHRIGT
jgi:putative flippase GtrA